MGTHFLPITNRTLQCKVYGGQSKKQMGNNITWTQARAACNRLHPRDVLPEKILNSKTLKCEKLQVSLVSVALGGESNFTAGESIAVTTLQRFIDSLPAPPTGCRFSMCKSLFRTVWTSAFDFDFEMSFSYSVTQEILQTNRCLCHRTN